MIRAIIDTDPGIDDAIALLYALRQPDLEIAALTTVAGNIGLDVTTRNAGAIAAMAGVCVPVHPGAAAPLGREPRPETGIHGDDGLGGIAFPAPLAEPSSLHAVEAMHSLLTSAPEASIDVFCLAPLTNIALLLARYPQSAMRIRRIIAMGGALEEPGNMPSGAEFNFGHDPEALMQVIASDLDITLIPLDATRQFRADAAYIADLRAMGKAPATASADLIAAYFAQTAHQSKTAESRPLHDPCVPLFALHPELFRVTERQVTVEPDTGRLIPGDRLLRVAMGLDARGLRGELRRGLAV
ncbi:nucleoside hydrolase [Pseudooceanicola algae]|uniref:Pyrimidine-specific ribonucleoside hydrolase RihA n=1 Tax=Pseudooceanicola algae TaxID=1537215 RepID=A0A418SEU3_9RHOB|nr:nucleoside hydrolase [Pseudooceanicola algae]QPM89759.1 Pyrimidine-specific ribonucleoside hydrolase RihA [Pseudooceanicola algae]